MQESRVTDQLVMSWVPVVGQDGRVHMEAHWQAPGATASVATSHAA